MKRPGGAARPSALSFPFDADREAAPLARAHLFLLNVLRRLEGAGSSYQAGPEDDIEALEAEFLFFLGLVDALPEVSEREVSEDRSRWELTEAGRAALGMLLVHEQYARHCARSLSTPFVEDAPPQDVPS